MENTCKGCIYNNTINDDLCGTCGDSRINKTMKQQPPHIIIYKNQPYSNLKLFCKLHNLKINTYSKKKFPIEFKGEYIYKNKLIKN